MLFVIVRRCGTADCAVLDWLAVVLAWIGLLVFFGCSHMAKKQFGGITGDLAAFQCCVRRSACWVRHSGGVLA
ncbi:MAG: hypothetical protein ACLUOF_01020 [Ruminococcus sp.]